MNKYPNDQRQITDGHQSKRTLWVVVILVIVIATVVVFTYSHRPITGSVTAVSATSITIRQSSSSANKTFSITNATMLGLPKSISASGVPQQFNANDIRIGETVVINVGPNNQAQAITLQ